MTNRIPPSTLKPTTSSTPADTAAPSSTAQATTAIETPPLTSTGPAEATASPSAADAWGTGATPPATSTTGLRYQGLPEVLLDHPAARVVHGDDPGDYYCEHMFFESQRAAVTSGTVARNRFGEPLVGFLHIPRDEFVRQEPQTATYAQESRHAGTREVVGAALGGFLLEAKTAVTGPVRIMLNGYDRFMDVVNNPTGDFVSHVENVDAVMQRALGSTLLTPTGELVPPESGAPGVVVVYRYRIKDTDFPDGREVLVRTQRFPVTDDAIDGQSHVSVQQGISRYRPHVVLSMGVAGGRNYMVEHHADDGGLRRRPGERLTHDGMTRPSESLADNFALARALVAGARPGISVASLRTGGQSPV